MRRGGCASHKRGFEARVAVQLVQSVQCARKDLHDVSPSFDCKGTMMIKVKRLRTLSTQVPYSVAQCLES
jgi:hypothetical protein